MEGDSTLQTLISVNEIFHFIRVTGENNDHIVAEIFHFLHDGVDCLHTEAVRVIRQGIGLVNEQYPSGGLMEFLLDVLGRPANIFANQVTAPALNERTRGNNLLFLQNSADQPGNRCFGTAGVPCEHHVKGGTAPFHIQHLPNAFHLMCGDDAVNQ